MINNVASKGRKMVTIVDPHLKKDDNYKVYSDAKSKELLVKNKDGNDYDGWCWPGMCMRFQEAS
jgi:alpha 1,3-glucosidase